MTAKVTYRRADDIGFLAVDNPPVNALSQEVRAGLVAALNEGLADERAEALVIYGQGPSFIAGADIREFGKPPAAPLLRDV
ncbi:MAG TPA: enoyl-CoA hydratase-related protein, partial [Kiloniellaceae bacterium]|nr:enoyl-CoA hydratase-related protein [Kiloniellaceae bacterium]